MSKTIRLIIGDAEITDEGILIKSFEIIDGENGEWIKTAQINDDLLKLLKTIEIDLSHYVNIKKMKEKNPNFTKLINQFKLYT
jgi:hypothetical protein